MAKDTHVTKDGRTAKKGLYYYCLLYTSDAADE